jgi:hypothetical protein
LFLEVQIYLLLTNLFCLIICWGRTTKIIHFLLRTLKIASMHGFFFSRLVMSSYPHGRKAVLEISLGSIEKHWNLILFQKIFIIG